MSLQGTLDDFGMIDLLQIPHHGSRTCQMTITGERGTAVLYYDRGQLVHARYQDAVGEKVLSEVIDWEKGSFEIVQDTQPPERSISKDLHTLLLLLVKVRDETASANKRKQEDGENVAKQLADQLEAFRLSSGLAVCLAIMDNSGGMVAFSQDESKPPALTAELQQYVSDFVNSYPRTGFGKAIFEDESGIVSAIRVSGSLVLLFVSERGTPLGAVTMGLNRLVTQITQKIKVEGYV